MKKFFMLLVSVSLLLALVLASSGCSCTSTPDLSFKDSFMGGGSITLGYTEKLTYKVNYKGDGKEYSELKKSDSTDSIITKDDIEYDGTFVTTFTVKNKNSLSVDSDILTDKTVETVNEIYYFKTELNLTATYKFKDSDTPTTVTDVMTTEVYFLPSGLSFAPIYSISTADMHVITLGSEERLARVTSAYKTTYNLNNFTVEKTNGAFNDKGEEVKTTDSFEKDYSFKKIIDNNQLLFAVRNFELNSENSSSINVLSPVYENAQTLSLSKYTAENLDISLETPAVNGALPVKNFSMCVANENARGTSHYFTVQTNKLDSLNNDALLVKYAQPLFDYSSMSCMGALEIVLSKVEHN